jgi:CheY-like chemotaxis protein
MSDQPATLNGSLRVLVVDDEFLIADYTTDILEEAGHRVVGTAASAEEALRVVETTEIDVAVVDITLRGRMDGIDLAHRLRQMGLRHLFISGSGDPTTLKRAQETGPLAFLQKPFDDSRLLAVLRNWSPGSDTQSMHS